MFDKLSRRDLHQVLSPTENMRNVLPLTSIHHEQQHNHSVTPWLQMHPLNNGGGGDKNFGKLCSKKDIVPLTSAGELRVGKDKWVHGLSLFFGNAHCTSAEKAILRSVL